MEYKQYLIATRSILTDHDWGLWPIKNIWARFFNVVVTKTPELKQVSDIFWMVMSIVG